MKEPHYRYFIRSRWQGRTETPPTIGAKFVKTLDALSAIDSIFANWEVTDLPKMSSIHLDAARPRIAAMIESNVVRDDYDEPCPDDGYHAIASAGRFKDPRSLTFKVDAGGEFNGGTLLEFAEHDVAIDLAIVTYPLFKAALLAINAIWLAPWACAQSFRSGAVSVPIDFGGRLLGWTACRRFPASRRFPILFFIFLGLPTSALRSQPVLS